MNIIFNLPLAISVVVSILTTAGAAAALHHLGSDQRQNKDHSRHLDWDKLTIGSKLSFATAGVLVAIIAGVAFYRVWSEGVLSGLASLAILLAVLVAAVMSISAWLVFWSAFSDGSPEQDDLKFYSKLLRRPLKTKASYEAKIKRVERRIAAVREPADAAPPEETNGRRPAGGRASGQETYS